jgi:rhamnogalacturonan endolyase
VDANMQESAKVTAPTATSGSGSNTLFANGNHNLSVADVDGDGKDEIIWGSAALDDDGKLLYATGFGHGDAIHLGDLNPDRKGLEVFQVHEEKGTYSWDIHDAATGEILMKGGQSGVDNGRGLAADIVADTRG